MKLFRLFLAAFAATALFTACSDDEVYTDTDTGDSFPTDRAAYVINQGNYYNGIDGTLDAISLSDSSYSSSIFAAINNQSLGDSPQNGVIYGSHLYIPMYGSNRLWVLDAKELTIVSAITTTSPEWVCAAGGAVFVSNNDGYVTRIDTLTLKATAKVAVGPNPAQMTAHGDRVYVSISDGYNWSGGCADGLRVAVIDATSGALVDTIPCGVNPGQLAFDTAGNLFVVARGTYEGSKVQKIGADGQAINLCAGSLIAINGTTLYAIDITTDWVTYDTSVTFKSYDTTTGALLSDDFLGASSDSDHAPYPVNINIDNVTGDLYICSDESASGYNKTGYVYVYHADGSFVKRYTAGIHPCDVVFN